MSLPAAFVCGVGGAPDDALRVIAGLLSCCEGSSTGDPSDCTCWETIYDREQAPVDRTSEPETRDTMCANCAYRPESPESQGDPLYMAPATDPLVPFWCHQGMRRAIGYRHRRLGIWAPASGEYYKPPIVEVGGAGLPFKADGSAGDRCAGWEAQRRTEAMAVAGLAAAAHEAAD